ncbi:helix-turn-helix transcriptional regulator [uncultured Roseibium sp.]|uniref:helix-turn-helix transcriptional regulator n=1 Tax=uncultured Roseibium sp. TaxID=1936171 RepID=UPI0026261305|nr:helix-turn-helix transcriptional regulator [uncultured Roseibium sp.]
MVISAEKFLHLSNLAVAAAMDPVCWQSFLDELGTVQGTRICTQLIGFDQLTKVAPLAFASGYDPGILELYEAHYSDKNPYAAHFTKCAVGDTISSDEMIVPCELKRTSFYADLLQPMEDIWGGGGAMLANDADRMFLIGGNIREKDRAKYESDWLELCRDLAPIIRQSLEINRTIAGLSFEKWAAEQHRLGSRTAILLVDAGRRIHYASSEAQELLSEGSVIEAAFGERVRFCSDAIQFEFSHMAQLQGNGRQAPFGSWNFKDPKGQGWTCRAMSVRLDELDRTPFRAFVSKNNPALLVAIKPEADMETLQRQVQDCFDLSKTEATAAVMLANGQSIKQIATNRSVSVHTVRNQIKAALSKSGCHRQSELVCKIEHLRLSGSV